ncbi:MAG: response regulator [Planctomycetota bacterium]
MGAVRQFETQATAPSGTSEATEGSGEASGALIVGARVLVVEDQKSQREFIARMLEEMHVEVDTASSGSTAMAILRTAAFNGMAYHLVLTDLHMPGGDGYQLLKAIRMDTGIRTMPVVVLSADADEEVILRCAAHGISSYIQKPASKGELRRVLANALACSSEYMRERDGGGAKGNDSANVPQITKQALEDLKAILIRTAEAETDDAGRSTASPVTDRIMNITLQWIERYLNPPPSNPVASDESDEDPDAAMANADDNPDAPAASEIDEDDPDASLAA